jgi:hypothetical protein
VANQLVLERLAGIQTILKGVHQAGTPMSSATKGSERNAFIDEFLAQVLPPIFRFGSGDVTDLAGARSGRVDVVVEFPWLPSLPVIHAGQHRLYLAEGVAAAIEVKSDLTKQWDEVVNTARQLAPLQRVFGGGGVPRPGSHPTNPPVRGGIHGLENRGDPL